MSELLQLKKQIEKERKVLDELVLGTGDITSCCVQSRKVDELIDKYYQLINAEADKMENTEFSPTYPPLCV